MMPELNSLPDLTEDIAKAIGYWRRFVNSLPHSDLTAIYQNDNTADEFLKTWLSTQVEYGRNKYERTQNAKHAS